MKFPCFEDVAFKCDFPYSAAILAKQLESPTLW